MQLFIYYDMDHGDLQVFKTFEEAEQYRNEQWGGDPEWEDCGDHMHDLVSDYVTIYKREVTND